MRRWRSAAVRVPETGKLEVHHGGRPRGETDPGWKCRSQARSSAAASRAGRELGRRGVWGDAGVSPASVSPLPALLQAAILQQTAEYIFSLEQEKTRLLQQNTQLKRFIQVAPACVAQGREGTVPADQGGDVVAVLWGRGKTLCPNKPGNGDVLHPPGWAGEPRSTQHPLPGRGRRAGVPFPIWGLGGQPGGSPSSGVAQLNCPGCHGVRSGFAQGRRVRRTRRVGTQGAGACPPAPRLRRPCGWRFRPRVLPMSPGSPFLAGGWLRGWRHPDVVWVRGRAPGLAPGP